VIAVQCGCNQLGCLHSRHACSYGLATWRSSAPSLWLCSFLTVRQCHPNIDSWTVWRGRTLAAAICCHLRGHDSDTHPSRALPQTLNGQVQFPQWGVVCECGTAAVRWYLRSQHGTHSARHMAQCFPAGPRAALGCDRGPHLGAPFTWQHLPGGAKWMSTPHGAS
jgi:hypothetical protein